MSGTGKRINRDCPKEGLFELGLDRRESREQGRGSWEAQGEETPVDMAVAEMERGLVLKPHQATASLPPRNRVSSEAHRLLWSA